MADMPAFQKKQYAFAAHIRDPDNNPAPPEIEDRRMEIYRSLFFNNLYSLLGGTFPVLKKIYGADGWRRLIRLFMIHHQAQTPYFLEVPREFVAFLQGDYPTKDQDYPFLGELAHYEWVELELSVSADVGDLDGIDPDGDLLARVPVKSRLSRVLVYQFPVQRISKDYLPDTGGEQPTFIAVYRRLDDEVGFMELNPVSARLLNLIDGNVDQLSGVQLLTSLAQEMNYPDPPALIEHGALAMQQMRSLDILLGTR